MALVKNKLTLDKHIAALLCESNNSSAATVAAAAAVAHVPTRPSSSSATTAARRPATAASVDPPPGLAGRTKSAATRRPGWRPPHTSRFRTELHDITYMDEQSPSPSRRGMWQKPFNSDGPDDDERAALGQVLACGHMYCRIFIIFHSHDFLICSLRASLILTQKSQIHVHQSQGMNPHTILSHQNTTTLNRSLWESNSVFPQVHTTETGAEHEHRQTAATTVVVNVASTAAAAAAVAAGVKEDGDEADGPREEETSPEAREGEED